MGVPAYYILASSEASSNLQRYDGMFSVMASELLMLKNPEDVYVRSRSEGFGEEVKRRIMLGTFSLSAGFYDAYFNKAAKVRRLIAQDFEDVFKDHDVIVGATGASTAFKIGAEIDDPQTMYMNDVLTVPVNMAGLPAMSIPAGFSAKWYASWSANHRKSILTNKQFITLDMSLNRQLISTRRHQS